MTRPIRRRMLAGTAIASWLCASAATVPPAFALSQSPDGFDGTITLVDTVELPAGSSALGLPFGGISGIDYDARTDSYLAISDDRSERAPARSYILELPFDEEGFTEPVPVVTTTSPLLDPGGNIFGYRHVDPEAIRWVSKGNYWWASEGMPSTDEDPFIRAASRDGAFQSELQLPAAYLPRYEDGIAVSGIRANQGFEGVTIATNRKELSAITENALVQDGPAATTTTGSNSRLISFDLQTGAVESEYVYHVEPVPFDSPDPAGFSDRGISDILRLNNQQYLVLERSFESGIGYQAQLFLASTKNATDLGGRFAVNGSEQPMTKQLLVDFNAQNIRVDNLEGMSFGPDFADGSRSLLVMSDDNFGASDGRTQVILLRVSGDD